jgi:hypothetical protein
MDIVNSMFICLHLFLQLFFGFTYKIKIFFVSKGHVFVLFFDLHVLCSNFLRFCERCYANFFIIIIIIDNFRGKFVSLSITFDVSTILKFSIYYSCFVKSRLKFEKACYYSVPNLLSSGLLSRNLKIKIYRTIILSVVL